MNIPQVFTPLVSAFFNDTSIHGVTMTSCTIHDDALEVAAEMHSPLNASTIIQNAAPYMDHCNEKEFHSVLMYYNVKIHGGDIEKFMVNKTTKTYSLLERAYFLELINGRDKFFALYTPVPSNEIIREIFREIDPTPAHPRYFYNNGSYHSDYIGAIQTTVIGTVFLSNNFNEKLYEKQKHKVRRSCIFN